MPKQEAAQDEKSLVEDKQKALRENGEHDGATMPDDSSQKHKRRSKEEAKSVSLALDDKTRQKLLNINHVHAKQARVKLPLSASVLYAIEIAHEAMFGKEYNDLPGDVPLD